METEVQSLKRRYYESRQKIRALKDAMKEQRTKSRQLIVSCALKIQEREQDIERVSKGTSENFKDLRKKTWVD